MTSGETSGTALRLKTISAQDHLAFVTAQNGSFLQRPGWAAVKTDWSNEYLGWFDSEDTLVASALVLHRQTPVIKRTLAYIAEGPVADWDAVLPESGPATLDHLLNPLTAHLKARGTFLVRIGPLQVVRRWDARVVRKEVPRSVYQTITDLPPTQDDATALRIRNALGAAGWTKLPGGIEFDIGQPEFRGEVPLLTADGEPMTYDQALAQMNQNARRETKKARGGLVEVTRTDGEGLERFHRMYVETAARDGFLPRPLGYLASAFEHLNHEIPGTAKVYLATQDGQDVAGAVRVTQGTRSIYMWAASTPAAHKVYATKAIFGTIIEDSIADGCVCVDQGGVSPTLDKGHPLAGLTVFKTTLGGDIVQTVGEWELELNKPLAKAVDAYMNLRRRIAQRRG